VPNQSAINSAIEQSRKTGGGLCSIAESIGDQFGDSANSKIGEVFAQLPNQSAINLAIDQSSKVGDVTAQSSNLSAIVH
jgi:hypothetical protein